MKKKKTRKKSRIAFALIITSAASAFLGGYVMQSLWTAVVLGAISGGLLGLLTVRRKNEKPVRLPEGRSEEVRRLPRQRGKRDR